MPEYTTSDNPACTYHTPPRVSVLMPVYNAETFLDDAVDSILKQTFDNLELICINDGSIDRSLDVLNRRAAEDPRLKVISRANTGIVGALNDGLAAASGEYIARMDADDTCSLDRFTKQVQYLDDHPDCAAVGTWCRMTDPQGSPTNSHECPTDHEAIDAALLVADGSAMVHATLMIRRAVLLEIGGWQAKYNWVEDLDLFLRLAESGRVANIPEYLYLYRRHLSCVCYTHYYEMCQRLKTVLIEAYERRGYRHPPDFSRIRTELKQHHSPANILRSWACHAIKNGNAGAARRHALAAMRREPLSLKSWRVMYWALSA